MRDILSGLCYPVVHLPNQKKNILATFNSSLRCLGLAKDEIINMTEKLTDTHRFPETAPTKLFLSQQVNDFSVMGTEYAIQKYAKYASLAY